MGNWACLDTGNVHSIRLAFHTYTTFFITLLYNYLSDHPLGCGEPVQALWVQNVNDERYTLMLTYKIYTAGPCVGDTLPEPGGDNDISDTFNLLAMSQNLALILQKVIWTTVCQTVRTSDLTVSFLKQPNSLELKQLCNWGNSTTQATMIDSLMDLNITKPAIIHWLMFLTLDHTCNKR